MSRRLGAEDRVEIAMLEVLDRHLEIDVQLTAVKGMKCAVMMYLEDGLQSQMVVGQ